MRCDIGFASRIPKADIDPKSWFVGNDRVKAKVIKGTGLKLKGQVSQSNISANQ
jgi:hypothetical protein